MKKLYLLFTFLSAVISAAAQDVIIKNDKAEIKSRVLEITEDVVKYKKFDFQDGPTYNINKKDVFLIIYKNGTRETFSNSTAPDPKKQTALSGTLLKMKEKAMSTSAAVAPASLSGNAAATGRNPGRYIGGFSYTRQITSQADAEYGGDEWIAVGGFKLAYEKFNWQKELGIKLDVPHLGLGLAYTSYLGYMENYNNQSGSLDWYTGNKHYATGYLFKEIAIKNILTLGVSGGGGLTYMQVRADEDNAVNPGQSSGRLGFGLHTGLYAQKSLFKYKQGQRSCFARFGADQFIMANSGFTAGTYLSFGF